MGEAEDVEAARRAVRDLLPDVLELSLDGRQCVDDRTRLAYGEALADEIDAVLAFLKRLIAHVRRIARSSSGTAPDARVGTLRF